jgi:hypothetical protein
VDALFVVHAAEKGLSGFERLSSGFPVCIIFLHLQRFPISKNGKKRTEIRTGSALSFLIVLWYGKSRREKEGPG